ncbi:toprim domain-containing protein [Pseudomonas urmiensis]|uniref:toprim domain-containing protein n=1 Tax=Pseudomonas urmiensis TaxID=2745493 RepID=UPI003D0AD97C
MFNRRARVTTNWELQRADSRCSEPRRIEVINGERREFKGFTTETEKGVYLANPKCANPTEIRFSEGGVDTLSTYQLASAEERQRILFIGTTGEPGPNTEAAIIALAERYKIQRFSLAYDRDQGGDSLTVKRHARLVSQFAGAQIEDVRERIGLLAGEDPNEALKRMTRIEEMSAQRKVQKFETVAPVEPTIRPVAQPDTQPSHGEDEAIYSRRS